MDKKGQYSAIVEKYDFDKSCFLQCYNKSSFYLKSHIINGVNLVKLHDIVKKKCHCLTQSRVLEDKNENIIRVFHRISRIFGGDGIIDIIDIPKT